MKVLKCDGFVVTQVNLADNFYLVFVYFKDQPVEILPHLYLGNFSHASQLEVLQRLGITSLMNVSKNCKNCFEDLFEYMTVPVDDNDSADLSSWFDSTIAFIGKYAMNFIL